MKTCISMLTLVTACLVHAQYTPVEELFYSIENDEVTITGADLNTTSLNIPPTIEGFPVTRIANSAFQSAHDSITSVVLPDSVTHIGISAFRYGSGLQSIEMPGVTYIEENAFQGCLSLNSLTFPSTLTSIGAYSFQGCNTLTSITLPASLISIGESAFYGCDSLTSFSVASGNPNFTILDGVLFNKAVTELLFYPIGNPATSYTLPTGIQLIHDRAFERCTSLTSITFSDSLTSIGMQAFYSCSALTSIDLPDSLTSIGNDAFNSCTSLTSIDLSDSLTSISDSTFQRCTSLTSITLPELLTSIGESAFYGCDSLTSITLPELLTSIGEFAFYRCDSLTSFSIASGNPNFTTLDGVLFNKAVTELLLYPIGNPATSYTLPTGIQLIHDRAFYECTSLTSVIFPDSLTSIDIYAFLDCTALTSVTLPASLTCIGDRAFTGCSSLTDVIFLGNAPTLKESLVFERTPATAYIYEGATGFGDTFGGLPVVVLSAGTPLRIDSITLENGNLLVKPTDGTDGITIEQTDDLIEGTWTPLTPTIVDGCFQLPASGTADFYRLSH